MGDKGCNFYNRSVKSWLEKNAIEMYSTQMKENLLLLKDLLEPYLNNKIYNFMTSLSKMCILTDKLDEIVNTNNHTYHRTIKLSLLMEYQSHTLTLVKKLITKILNLNIFAKSYNPNMPEECFVVKK